MDSPILTLEQAAALLTVTPDWLRRSRCPRIRHGRNLVRYDREATLAWFRSYLDAKAA